MRFVVPNKTPYVSAGSELGVDILALTSAMVESVQEAWEVAIKPRMQAVRDMKLSQDDMKIGVDFFTEADVESEKIIKSKIQEKFSPNTFRIFGEEVHAYEGNLNAPITIRIDPIDGTAQFKFGQAQWGIMVGAYVGRDADERQIAAVVYFPEYYNEIVFRIGDVGTFCANLASGEITQYQKMDSFDNFADVLFKIHKSHDLTKRGNIDELFLEINKLGGRIITGSPMDTKEALATRGRRVFITNKDWDQVDFILTSSLVMLGYKIFNFEGVPQNIDDPALTGSNFILLPPGKIGDLVLKVMGQFHY